MKTPNSDLTVHYSRPFCAQCRRPAIHCLCKHIRPIPCQTRFVFLMHPMEYKRVRANTGRLAHLSLPGSEIIVGINFNESPRLQELISLAQEHLIVLYPNDQALDISQLAPGSQLPWIQGPTVLIIDATWAHARKIYRLSTCLHLLPAFKFMPAQRSRYQIKKQPASFCLSTIEACAEILEHFKRLGSEKSTVSTGPLIELFDRMQAIQIDCMDNPPSPSHRI